MIGRVIKKNADQFLIDNKYYIARGNLKNQGIFVGDMVEICDENNIIEKVYPRKNLLIRPPLANVDKMIIVIAPIPKPDFLLIDKLIIFCNKNKILPVLCVNKCDILEEELKNIIISSYSDIIDMVFVSAKNNEVDTLYKSISGVCAFAGQSAVGKSSILNCLLKEDKAEVGELGKKVDRGKQTTRIVSLYQLSNSSFIADTAGFSKFDESLLNLDEKKLAYEYYEFVPFIKKCKFVSCNHIKEKDCELKKAVENGEVPILRYKNYLKLYDIIKTGRK